MRLLTIAMVLAAALVAAPAHGQALPEALRSAGVTQAQWDVVRAQARVQAQRAHIAEASLLAAAEAASVNLAASGEFDPFALQHAISEMLAEQANQIAELQRRLEALTGDVDPDVGAVFAQAYAALSEGRLADADRLLAQVAEHDLAAIQQADLETERRRLRAGETIASRGQVAYVQADYLLAASHYARAAETAPDSAIEARWRFRLLQARARVERAVRFVEPLDDAVLLYEQLVLPLAPRGARPDDWATTQINLGIVLQRQGERGTPGALERALAAYEAALAERTRESNPVAWAETQIALGSVLKVLGERGAPGGLERAQAAYEAALTVLTLQAYPQQWVMAQNNLGAALRAQGERGVPGALERAVEAFEAALSGVVRETDPTSWAQIQINRGFALQRQGERGVTDALERSVAAYEAVLTVVTRDTSPAQWAATQVYLGNSLGVQGARGAPGALERSAAAFEAALTVLTREADPAAWAATQNNLGLVRQLQGERGAPEALEQAVSAYEAALTVRTRDADPPGWALTQMNLGVVLVILGENGAPGALERAVAAYEAVLTVRTREADPAGWAQTSHNLAVAYRALGRLREARAVAEAALAVYEQVGNTYSADDARIFLADLQQREARQGQMRALVSTASAVRPRDVARLPSGGSRDVQIEAGGQINANVIGAPCVGYISSRPTLVLNYRSGRAPLFVSATSDEDTTLVVRTPDGLWRCDDDSGGGQNPGLEIAQPASGRYAIWVGTYAGDGAVVDAVLHLAPAGSLLSQVKRPNPAVDPAFGVVNLSAGFEPDPHTRALSAGGALDASVLGISACVGFVSHGPAYRLNWQTADGPLAIAVQSDGDTTLLISDPAGTWTCNDDSDGLNPAITFATPEAGQYDIWVGTFDEGAALPAVLRITTKEP